MEIRNTIGESGCACGAYESDGLRAEATCRKSSGSPDSSLGVAHLLKYETKNEEGLRELGDIIEDMFGYGADYIRVENDIDLPTHPASEISD